MSRKLSQIAAAGANFASTDFLVGVTGGNTKDVRFSLAQVAAGVGGGGGGTPPGGSNLQIQYNNAGAFGGLTDSAVASRVAPFLGQTITPQQFGAFGDGGSHPITLTDIANNPQWKGPYNQAPLTTYPVGTEWDTVGTQEAIYACFAQTSTPGNIVWNTNSNTKNARLFFPPGHYLINRQVWCSASGWNISADNKLGTKLKWQGYSALNKSDFSSYFTCNSHTTTTLDGISAADIAQLHAGMNVRQIVGTQDQGGIPWNTTIVSVASNTVTLSNAATVTTSGMKVFVWLDMLHMDSTSYGAMNQVALQADALIPRQTSGGGGTAALMTIDNTVPFSTLSPQFLSFYDCSFFGNQNADVGVSIVPIAGGSGQGSNIQFINNDISSCWRAGLRINGSNALNVNWYNGDMQNCRYDGISGTAFGGQILGCSFENQIGFFTVPLQNQFSNMGRDILANGVGGSLGNAVEVQDVRSEGQVGVICNNGGPAMVKDYGITNSNIEDWSGNTTWFPGEPIIPSMNNTKGRAFICVESGGENIWRTADGVASSGDTVVFTPDPGWSANQWAPGGGVNYFVQYQFTNTFPQQFGPITSSTHNSITITGSGLGGIVNGNFFPIAMILKQNGAVAPNFDSLAGATFVEAGSIDQGFYPHAGTNKVGVGSGDAGNISVGTGIMVRDTIMIGCFNSFTPQFPYALTSLVTATGSGTPNTDLTTKQNVIFGQTTGGTPGRDGYYGAVLDDNGIKWMELPYSGHEGCILENCEAGNGFIRACENTWNVGTSRLDGPGLAGRTDFDNSMSPTDYRNQRISYVQGPHWIRPLQTGTSSGTIDLTSRIESSDCWVHTPTGNTTYNFPDFSAIPGRSVTLYRYFGLQILTSGTTSFTLTFGTNTVSAGTLTTGTVDSKRFFIRFFYDGLKWMETSRIGPL